MTAFFTIWVLRSPSTSVRKSSRPIRPADAAPRDGAAAKVHPLEAGRVHEDLEARLRLRHLVHARGVELEGEARTGAAVRPALVVVGAQGPVDELEVGAEDPVLVEARHRLEAAEDPARDRVGGGAFAGRSLVRAGGSFGRCLGRRLRVRFRPRRSAHPRRIEAGVKQGDEVAGEGRVGAQGVLDVGLAEPEADLAKVLRIGAEHGDLPPVEAGREGEPVEAVVLRLARPHPGEAALERLARRFQVRDGRTGALPEPEVVEPHRTTRAAGVQLARMLVLHPKAHVLEHRERVREVHRPAEVEELEAERAGIGPGGPEEVHRERTAGRPPVLGPVLRPGHRRRRRPLPLASPAHERLGQLDVAESPVRAVPAAVTGTEHRLVAVLERGPRLRAEPLGKHPRKRPAPFRRHARRSPVPGRGHGRLLASPGCAPPIVAAGGRALHGGTGMNATALYRALVEAGAGRTGSRDELCTRLDSGAFRSPILERTGQ